MIYHHLGPACRINVQDDHAVNVWAGSKNLYRESVAGAVRNSLSSLDDRWAFELHQYLANSGRSVLLYGLSKDAEGNMPLSMGDVTAGFGQALMLGTTVTSPQRVQLGVSILTAFAVYVSQGGDPREIDMVGIARQIQELQLPVE